MGEFWPFLLSLFVPDQLSYLFVAILGVIVGFIIVVVMVSLVKWTNTELPETESTEMINHIMKTPSGIAVSSLGGGFFEEFFFRGVLIGLFYWLFSIVRLGCYFD
ncbi:hypothetical protein [Shouchella clausii]|uniref:hypothetical protein n=1 Tax=Shouchella clausii TaxID=79880 RepID=UPI001154FACA|nr:hypothetical protein [Shouchella clausii]